MQPDELVDETQLAGVIDHGEVWQVLVVAFVRAVRLEDTVLVGFERFLEVEVL